MTDAQQDSSLGTVLVIEDDEDTRLFVEDLLTMSGYAVVGAACGQEGLAAANVPVDVILLDRRLPDADGLELCRRLREQRGNEIPVIFLTADRSPQLETEARAAGATDFLHKPFPPDALLERLARLA